MGAKDRILYEVSDPENLLKTIDSGRSWFVKTHEPETLFQRVDLMARLPDGVEVQLDVIVVASRRAQPGTRLAAGVEVKAVKSEGIDRLRHIVQQSKVVAPKHELYAEARYATRKELLDAAETLLRRETLLMPVDRYLERGSIAQVQLLAPGVAQEVNVLVRGTAHTDREWQARATLEDESFGKLRLLVADLAK